MVEVADNNEIEKSETYLVKIKQEITEKKQLEKIKLITIGDCNVGKTSIIKTFSNNRWMHTYPTIAIDSKFVNVTLGGKPAQLQLWDTSG